MSRFDGKVAIITGAAQGQGAAEARRLVDEGAHVVIGDILDDLGAATAAELGDASTYVHLDVSEPGDWEKAVSAATERGPLRILVNNAALSWMRALENETVETMERMWRVNVLGPFLGIKAVSIPMREAGGGSIINTSSVAGLNGMAYNAAYGSTKWALRGLSRTAAIELGQYGIRVNTIHPGPVNTGMLPGAAPGTDPTTRYAHLPLQRMAEPEEIAGLVAYLASDESSFITGSEIAIDGGTTAGPTKPATPPFAVLL